MLLLWELSYTLKTLRKLQLLLYSIPENNVQILLKWKTSILGSRGAEIRHSVVEIHSETRVNLLLHKLGSFHKVESESQADHDASVASFFFTSYSHYSNEEMLVKNCDCFYKLQRSS